MEQGGVRIKSLIDLLTLKKSIGVSKEILQSSGWIETKITGDVNCDETTNSTDAMLILRHSLGLDMSGTGWCEN